MNPKQDGKTTTHSLVIIALTTAIIAILTQISVPSPTGVPVTLQTFAVALVGYMLLPKHSFYSILLYLLLGAIGFPVFTNFRGGLSHLVGLTGGFLWGYFIYAPLCGLGMKWTGVNREPTRRGRSNRKALDACLAISCGTAGLFICHTTGTLQYAFLTSNSVTAAFTLVSLPYLFKDVLCVAAAYFLAKALRSRLLKSGVKIE